MKTGSIRREYQAGLLEPEKLTETPLKLFGDWMNEAIISGIDDATAMALATIGADGFPHTRIVLLKSFDEEGFTFFTNYNSLKAKSISRNKKVSLNFFWSQLQRQVRINGEAQKTSEKVSDEYFSSRQNNSRLGAWASNQSETIDSRNELKKKFNFFKEKFKGKTITRPSHWGGYHVKPVLVEFWQGRKNRLHDRFLYEKINGIWKYRRLAP